MKKPKTADSKPVSIRFGFGANTMPSYTGECVLHRLIEPSAQLHGINHFDLLYGRSHWSDASSDVIYSSVNFGSCAHYEDGLYI